LREGFKGISSDSGSLTGFSRCVLFENFGTKKGVAVRREFLVDDARSASSSENKHNQNHSTEKVMMFTQIQQSEWVPAISSL
jgi:hypothetical protein